MNIADLGLYIPPSAFERVGPERTGALDAATCEWLKRYGVVRTHRQERHLLRIQTGKLSAFTLCRCDDEAMRLASDLIAWLFVFDDCYAEGEMRRDVAGLTRRHRDFDVVLGLELDARSDDPFVRSLIDLYGRLLARAPEAWLRQLSGSLRRYFDGCEREVDVRAFGRSPSIEGYLAYRHESIGVYPVIDVVEMATSCYLGSQVVAHPRVREVRRLASLASALLNDIFSSMKEIDEDGAFNIVTAIARERGVDRAGALQRAALLHNQLMEEYLECERLARSELCELPSWDEAMASRFDQVTMGIRTWFEANRTWSAEVPRYHHLPVAPASEDAAAASAAPPSERRVRDSQRPSGPSSARQGPASVRQGPASVRRPLPHSAVPGSP